MIKLLVIISFSFFNDVHVSDSVGIETINGKTFIIHRVEEKETLFAISRRYGSSVDAIVQYNATAASGLEIGQLLKIPYTPKQPHPVDGIVHKVAPKETLFSISRAYGVSLDEIKKWNNLTDNALSIGQDLVIKKKNTVLVSNNTSSTQQTPARSAAGSHTVAEKETLYSIARQYGITVDQLKSWNKLEASELKIGQSLIVSAPAEQTQTLKQIPVNQNEKPTVQKELPKKTSEETRPVGEEQKPVTQQKEQTITISESVKNGDEIVEMGLAELIEGTEGNRKYLALHRTAPVGTILKVKNEMNSREVFVRVMGKLPETALTDKLVIKISKSAYDRLGAIDPRFRVEVTYYK
jgi:LysM repeat protein